MAHAPRTFDGIEVVPLCDAVGPMASSIARPLDEMFAGSSLTSADEWILHFHCYLIRAAKNVLVDTGVGTFATWAPTPGRLHEELSSVGLSPGDIDVVVLTHMHSDHAGGAVDDGAPAFPNARYVLQGDELAWAAKSPLLPPLRDSLQIVYGEAQLLPGVSVHHTPGHTPGHQVVSVGSLTLTGDVVLHPVQLADPSITYMYDDDPALAAETRADVLKRAGVIGTGHFAAPFVDL